MLLSTCLRIAWHHVVVSFQLQVICNVFCVCVCCSIIGLQTLEGKCHSFRNDTRNMRQRTIATWAQPAFSATSKGCKHMVFIFSTPYMKRTFM